MNLGHHTAAQPIMEAWGIVFLGPVPNDALFQYVTLPEGWHKQPTEHSMWSHLLDDKDRKRASIFYKAAFYDRSAQLHLEEENLDTPAPIGSP